MHKSVFKVIIIPRYTHLGLLSGFGSHVQRSSATLEAYAWGEGSGGADGGKEGDSGEFHFDGI
jgi:hypothetical protein